MISKFNAPQCLITLMNVYKKANSSGKAYTTTRDVIMHNNMPVNILKAVTVLKDVDCLVRINWLTELDKEYTLRYLSEVSGYSVTELIERM
jgi:hypothetical protein